MLKMILMWMLVLFCALIVLICSTAQFIFWDWRKGAKNIYEVFHDWPKDFVYIARYNKLP